MTDHKFTDEEVIKALECCADATQNSCKGCPCKAKGMRTGDVCIPAMSKAAAELIKRQRVEIDALKIANEKMYAAAKEPEAEIERLEGALKAEERHNQLTMEIAQKAVENAKTEGARSALREIHGRALRHFRDGHIDSLEIDTTTWNAIVKKFNGEEP